MEISQANALQASTDGKRRHFRGSTVLVVALMCLGSTAYAYAGGVIATTLGQPSWWKYMGLLKNPNEKALVGATTSMFYVGGFFGAFLSEWVGDRWGRKAAIFSGLAIVMASAALCAGSVNIAMFIVFRTTAGFGGLMLSMAIPLWITECVPPEVRGSFAQMHGAAISGGYTLAGYVGVGFYKHINREDDNVWRGPLAIGCAFCIPLLVGIWWAPESPRFLLLKARTEAAWAVIRRFHTRPGDDDISYAEREMDLMRKQIELDRTLPSSWIEMFRRPSYRKRLWMSVVVVFIIQITGSQVLAIYATTIFADLGYGTEKVLLLQAGINVMCWPIAAGAVFWTEKFRRTTLISFGLAGQALVVSCFAGLSAHIDPKSSDKSIQIGATAMVYLFFAFYSASVEGPFYYYVSELFPTHLRAKGMAIQATTFAWTSILWAQTAPTALVNIGWKFFLIFIIGTSLGAIFIFFYYPDTQGKTLEEIAVFFGDEDIVVAYQQTLQEVGQSAIQTRSEESKAEVLESWEEHGNPSPPDNEPETKV